jgi:hypothetical protein
MTGAASVTSGRNVGDCDLPERLVVGPTSLVTFLRTLSARARCVCARMARGGRIRLSIADVDRG